MNACKIVGRDIAHRGRKNEDEVQRHSSYVHVYMIVMNRLMLVWFAACRDARLSAPPAAAAEAAAAPPAAEAAAAAAPPAAEAAAAALPRAGPTGLPAEAAARPALAGAGESPPGWAAPPPRPAALPLLPACALCAPPCTGTCCRKRGDEGGGRGPRAGQGEVRRASETTQPHPAPPSHPREIQLPTTGPTHTCGVPARCRQSWPSGTAPRQGPGRRNPSSQ